MARKNRKNDAIISERGYNGKNVVKGYNSCYIMCDLIALPICQVDCSAECPQDLFERQRPSYYSQNYPIYLGGNYQP